MRLEEEQKKAEKKKKKKSGAKESDEPTYKNAAEMIAAMKNKSKGPQEKVSTFIGSHNVHQLISVVCFLGNIRAG